MFPRCSTFMAVAVGALALPASAAALPAGGIYTGNVSTPFGPQERSPAYLQLGKDPSKAADARIYYIARCQDGSVLSNVINYDATDRVREGKMRRTQQWDDLKLDDGTVVKETSITNLTFTDTRVSGTVRVQGSKTPPNGQPIPCDTGAMRVALRRNGAFGGAVTPQQNPAVLSRTSRQVRLSVRISAPCKPAGELGRSIVITAPIRDGRFAEDDDLTYTQTNGTKITLAYELSGRLGRTKTTGALRVRATSVRPDGSAGPTCDSGAQKLTLRR